MLHLRLFLVGLLLLGGAGAGRAQENEPGRFLTGPRAGEPLEIVREFLRQRKPANPRSRGGGRVFEEADFDTMQVRRKTRTKHNGVTHLSLRQKVRGLPVYNGQMEANVDRDGRLISLHNRFAAQAGRRAPAPSPVLSAEEALRLAAAALSLPAAAAVETLPGESKESARFSAPQLSIDEIPAQLMYFETDAGELRLVWNFVLHVPDGSHWWDVNIDAATGGLLSQADWVHRASYRVYPFPFEGPQETASALVTDPFDPAASPFGWHDTNGVAGAEFTDTRGNNVLAQEDRNANDTGGFRPSGGAALTFDFAADFSSPAQVSQSAAVTSLFYWTNRCHDLFYRFGFDEVSGNFQQNNYGRGGSGNDAVRADAQDGQAFNNAFFASPPDGQQPNLTMGLASRIAYLDVLAPAGIARRYSAGEALFGPDLAGGSVSGEARAALDAGPVTTDACTTILNPEEIFGRVALVDRGMCDFTVKVANAQAAGAIAALIVNNAGEGIIGMSGTDPSITIPSLFLRQSEGGAIRGQLALGVTVQLGALLEPDSSFDAGVIIHEYAHGVSNRLTGGPANASALNGLVPGGMGEGWSDFFALAFTTKTTDTRTTSRRVAVFAFNPDGIRKFPYSTDLAVNPRTYADVAGLNEVHDIGEVWAAVLYDLYWDLVRIHGFDPEPGQGTGGNTVALQLVVDGLKFQPAGPSFTDARDAILAADLADYGGVHRFTIWAAFARRGLGLNATEGTNPQDVAVTAAYDLPAGLDAADDDSDGLPNLAEQAFATNPLGSDTDNLPRARVVTVGGTEYPAIEYTRRAGGSGATGVDYTATRLRYAVEVSENLSQWSDGAALVTPVSVAPSGDGYTERVVVRTGQSVAAEPRQFLRVRVSRVP